MTFFCFYTVAQNGLRLQARIIKIYIVTFTNIYIILYYIYFFARNSKNSFISYFIESKNAVYCIDFLTISPVHFVLPSASLD